MEFLDQLLQEPLINKIIRSKRRTLSLEIASDASLVIRAPLRISMNDINRIVQQKRAWILSKQQRAKEQGRQRTKKQFVEGEEFLYLGSFYKLRIIPGSSRAFDFSSTEFLITQEALLRAKSIFQAWYIQKAKELIPLRVQYYAQMARCDHSDITITSAQTRWGSCTSKKTLNFSWRLMMAPLEMIDYVVAHEVAHLSELNHSSRFWNKLESFMPDYKQREQWFKSNQHLLNL